MATINTTHITNVLRKNAPLDFYDAISRNNTFINMLLARRRPSMDPKGLRWKVKTTGMSEASTFAEGATYPEGDRFTESEAFIGWARYVQTIELTGDAKTQLENYGSAQMIANYFAQQQEEAIRAMQSAQDADALSGDNTNGLTGITSMIADANTYAGLDRTTVTNWQSYENTTASGVTMAILDDMHNELTDTRRGNYTAILSDTQRLDEYTSLTSGNGAPNTINMNAGGIFAAGWNGATYRGRPWIAIPGYTANRIDFIDENGLFAEEFETLRVSDLQQVQGKDKWVWWLIHKLQIGLQNPRKQSAFNASLT
jgi:hypothetical protein